MTQPRFACVILESPFASPTDEGRDRNRAYLLAAMLDCLSRGEAPFASHGLYTQCLDDNVPHLRDLGIRAGFAWRHVAEKTVVYTDLGESTGMKHGITHAKVLGQPIEYRTLPGSGWGWLSRKDPE